MNNIYKRLITFFVLSIVFTGIGIGAIPAQERAALIALYNATKGDSWHNKNGWKTPPLHTDGFAAPGTEEDWYGVTLSGDHVTSLSGHQNKLTGPIPPELSNLTNLTSLYLGNNYLIGAIPPELGNLINLQSLSLISNGLSGSIPPELGNLNNLKYLHLEWNQLSGGIPPQLSNLSNLEELDLGVNKFNGPIPPELGDLGNLRNLDLSINPLTGGIPSQLGNLGNLQTLTLIGDHLSGPIPLELGNLNNLKSLSLASNNLTGGIPSQLGNLSNLSILSLSGNLLSGGVPLSFKKLTAISDLNIGYNCLSATDSALRFWLFDHDPDWEEHQDRCDGGSIPEIGLNYNRLNFNALSSGNVTGAQTILVNNNAGGVLNWSASANVSWISFSPTSGTGNSILSVSVNPTDMEIGNYTGTITITDPNASNSPIEITVHLNIKNESQDQKPFGDFSTPIDGTSGVSGSIAVTGWALDDIGLESVKIYRSVDGNLSYIGDSFFVEGARPDIELDYPDYPNATKAGWGYLMLTNFLPDGETTLTAIAKDTSGNEIVLGTKTITIDNANAVNPFGAIDTPTQGGIASGKKFVNFGWALTPQPSNIPVDGSTITVTIDGVIKGNPTYNIFRSDIAGLFPGFANTSGAVGYFYIDTTTLSNGLHTIWWNVNNNVGNSGGIGSRYFSVMNAGRIESALSSVKGLANSFPGLEVKEDRDVVYIEIKELERVEVNLADEKVFEGYAVVGDKLRKLPIGSTLDTGKDVFYWQPGPGFLGEHRLVFFVKDNEGRLTKKNVVIKITPAY